MKKTVSLLLAFFMLTGLFTAFPAISISAREADITYKLTITDKGNGVFALTAAVPAGVRTGKIIVSVSEDLALVSGSLTSPEGKTAAVNEEYSRDGVTGACVVFANSTEYVENAVIFSAVYTAAEDAVVDASDFTVPLWYISDIDTVIASNADGDVSKIFIPYEKENSSEYIAEITYTVTLTEKEDGYTITAALPAGVEAGKIVVNTEGGLTLVSGSVVCPAEGGVVNERYNRDGVTGACVTFANPSGYNEGDLVFSAEYTAAEGASIGKNDFSIPLWYLADSNGKFATDTDGDVVKVFVPLVYDVTSDDVTSDDVTSDDVTSDDVTSDDVTSDDVTSDDVTSDDVTSDDVTSDDVTSDDVTSDDGTSDDVTSDDVTSDDVTSDDVTSDDVTSDDVTSDDVTSDDVTSDDVTSDDVTSDDITSDDVTSDDITSDDVTSDDVTSDDVTFDDVTSDDVTSDDVTSDDVTSDDVTSDDVTSDDVTSDDVTSDDVASDDVTSDDVTSDDVASDDVASDDVTSDDTSSDEPMPDISSENLLLDANYTYDINAFFSSFSDNDNTLLTDGVYRGNGADWNDIQGVAGVTVEMAGSYAENVISFELDKATSVGTIVMRGVHAFFQNSSVNRHMNIASIEVTKDGTNYTAVTYDVKFTPIEGAPTGTADEQDGAEGPRFFDVTVTVKGAVNITGFRLTLNTLRGDNTNAYIVELDEIEAYAPAPPTLPVEGTWGGLTWILDKSYTLTVKGNGAMNDFTSGATDAWLAYKDFIKEAVIDEGVTSVSAYAFEGCTALASLSVGKDVTAIGKDAFNGCNALINLYIDSPYIAFTITNASADGYISLNAESIAIEGAYTEVSAYIKNNFELFELAPYKGKLYAFYTKHDHLWEVYSLPATDCINRGFEGHKCSECGALKGYETLIHSYDDACDASCNLCGEARRPVHAFGGYQYGSHDHWKECSLCGYRKDIDPHYYENGCDTECDECGYVRKAPHSIIQLWELDDTEHWINCEDCGVQLIKSAHEYDDEYDSTCSYCGYTRDVPHDTHLYDNPCDTDCNLCGEAREVSHSYKNAEGYYQCEHCGDKLYTTPDGYELAPKEGANCTLEGGFVFINNGVSYVQTVTGMFDAEVTVFDVRGKPMADGVLVGTGCKVALTDDKGEITDYIVVIIVGDLDGDAYVTATDYVALERLVKNPSDKADYHLPAGDLNGDGTVNAADLIALKIKLFY